MKITVIYHLYKESVNLVKSLKSLLSQDCKKFELILVFDAGSDQILNEIKENNFLEYDNVRMVKFFENKGRSFTFNYAIEKAKGDYIYFAEPKIFFEDNFVEKLHALISTNDYDYVSFVANEKHNKFFCNVVSINLKDRDEKIKTIINTKLSLKDKIFNKEFLIKNKINFVNYKNLCSLYMFDVIEDAKTCYMLCDHLISVRHEPKHHYEYNLYNILEAAELLTNRLNKMPIDNEYVEAYRSWIPTIVLYEFIKKIYLSYFKKEKIIAKSIENAVNVLERIYPNFKYNKHLSLMYRKDIYEYISNFENTVKYIRRHINKVD